MPVSDREIWTAANLIIKRLGAEARREAVERAGDMLVRGNAEGSRCLATDIPRHNRITVAADRDKALSCDDESRRHRVNCPRL